MADEMRCLHICLPSMRILILFRHLPLQLPYNRVLRLPVDLHSDGDVSICRQQRGEEERESFMAAMRVKYFGLRVKKNNRRQHLHAGRI